MNVTKITGASDDLIELKGQITEEFSHNSYEVAILAFSDGTLLEVTYDNDGIWRIKQLAAGSCSFSLKPGIVADDTFDEATLTGDLKWCVHAIRGQYNPAWGKK